MSAREIKQEIMNKLDIEYGVDYILVNKAVGNFKPMIDWIIGIIVVLTIMLLLVIIALELLYLMSPGIK